MQSHWLVQETLLDFSTALPALCHDTLYHSLSFCSLNPSLNVKKKKKNKKTLKNGVSPINLELDGEITFYRTKDEVKFHSKVSVS